MIRLIIKTLQDEEYNLNIEEKSLGRELYKLVLEQKNFIGIYPESKSCYKIKLFNKNSRVLCDKSLYDQDITEQTILYAIIPFCSGVPPCECIKRNIDLECSICREIKKSDEMCLLNYCSHSFCLVCVMNIYNLDGDIHACLTKICCPLCRTFNDRLFSHDYKEVLNQKLCLKCYE
jgi:hypothetical protein